MTFQLHGCDQPGSWRSDQSVPDFRNLVPNRPQAPHQLFGTKGCGSYSASLGLSATGPSGHGCYVQYYGSFLYQQAAGHGLTPYIVQ